MFENLKKVMHSPIRNLVKGEYTGEILSNLIISELKSMSPNVVYTVSDIEEASTYLENWIKLLTKYSLNHSLWSIRIVSSSTQILKSAFKHEEVPDDDPDKETLFKSKGRTIFYHLCSEDVVIRITDEMSNTEKKVGKITNPIPKSTLTIKQLMDALDEAIIGQDEAKKAVAVGIMKHIQRVENPELDLDKSNIIMIGPSGTGKTEMVRVISKKMGVPYVIEDASSFTPSGYRGRDTVEILNDLLKAADGNIDLAERGIVFLDEFDKICCYDGDDWLYAFLKSTQSTLLKVIEDGSFELENNNGGLIKTNGSKRTMTTKNILFIAAGAFPELTKYRKPKKAAGFLNKRVENEFDGKATHKDLIHYGMMREIAGRFSTIAELNPLSLDDLYKITVSAKNSVFKQYERMFIAMGLHLDIPDEKIRELCANAFNERIGARGLKTVFDSYFEDVMYKALSEAAKEENMKEEEQSE